MVIDLGYWKKVFKRISTLAITIIGIYLSFKLAVFYMPFLIAFIISLLVEPIIRKLHSKTELTRKSSAIIVLIIVFIFIVGLLIWGIANIINEGSNLLSSLNLYIDDIYKFISGYIDKLNFEELNLSGELQTIIKNSTSSLLENVSNWISGVLKSVISWVSSLGNIGIYTIITILATYFICVDRMYILDQIEHHFPRDWVKKFSRSIKKIITLLGGYLKAEATLVGINFVLVLIRIMLI